MWRHASQDRGYGGVRTHAATHAPPVLSSRADLLCCDHPPAHSAPPVLAPRLTTPNALVFLRRFVKAASLARNPAVPRSQPELQAAAC